MSALAPPSMLLIQSSDLDSGDGDFVVGSCIHGAISLPVTVANRGGKTMSFSRGFGRACDWNVILVDNLDDWFVREVKAVCPAERACANSKPCDPLFGLTFEVVSGAPIRLVEYAASKAFAGLSVHHFSKLVDILECGQTHAEALRACLRWAWERRSDMGRGVCPWDFSG